jgi:hypothetical protein
MNFGSSKYKLVEIGWIAEKFKNSYWISLQNFVYKDKHGFKNEIIRLNVKP